MILPQELKERYPDFDFDKAKENMSKDTSKKKQKPL